jgi:hypothetical protein
MSDTGSHLIEYPTPPPNATASTTEESAESEAGGVTQENEVEKSNQAPEAG